MQAVIDVVLPGLVVGCIYGLIGMAFAVIYKATRVVNFALGEMMMLITYLAYSIQGYLKLSFPLLVLVTIVISSLIGWIIEFLIIRPMRGQSLFAIVMSTIGLAIVLRSVTSIAWGALSQPISVDLPTRFYSVLGVNLSIAQIMIVLLLLFACIAMTVFFRFTRIGLLMRATASNESTALLLGVKVGQIHALAWIGSAVIAGLAGILIALIQNLGPELFHNGFKGFPATVLGGLDSVVGSGLGGIIIGVTENITGRFFGSGAKELAGLVIIILVLMIRPYGLFGQRGIERV